MLGDARLRAPSRAAWMSPGNQDPLVVVLQHHHIHRRQRLPHSGHLGGPPSRQRRPGRPPGRSGPPAGSWGQTRNKGNVWWDLVFRGGGAGGIADDPFQPSPQRCQGILQHTSGIILTHASHHIAGGTQGEDVRRHVISGGGGRPLPRPRLLSDPDHRHRSFRGDPIDDPGNVPVQHQVPHHQDPHLAHGSKELDDAIGEGGGAASREWGHRDVV